MKNTISVKKLFIEKIWRDRERRSDNEKYIRLSLSAKCRGARDTKKKHHCNQALTAKHAGKFCISLRNCIPNTSFKV